MNGDVLVQLASADPADLLPARRSEEAAQVVRPLTAAAASDLGGSTSYLLLEDARGVTYGVPAVRRQGRLARARAGDGVAAEIVAAVVSGRTEIDGLELTAFAGEPAASGERAIDVDQTNDLVVVGERAIVKWFLHPTAGEQPAVERLAALESTAFSGTPRTWGLVHRRVGDDRFLVATVTAYLAGAEDGWDWAVADVRALARGEGVVASALDPVHEAGRLIGSLHASLAAAGVGEASPGDAARWLGRARDDLARADLEPAVAGLVDARLASLGDCVGTPTILVHGDLHIGQILRAGEPARYYVIDFDGNPTQSIEERLERQPAARDVAGMLASLDHVGRVVLHRTEGLGDAERARVLGWIEEAQRAFLGSYEAEIGHGGHPELLDRALLGAMQVQQECREYVYAARYLPHWRYVPDAALTALLSRSAVPRSEAT